MSEGNKGMQVVLMEPSGRLETLWLPAGRPQGIYRFQSQALDSFQIEGSKGKWYAVGGEAVQFLNRPAGQERRVELSGRLALAIRFRREGRFDDFVLYAEEADSQSAISEGFRVQVDELRIGRDAASDIYCENPMVSGHHAVLRRDERGWSVTDTDSLNGIYVNDQRVKSARLKIGDELFIVGLRIVVGADFLSIHCSGRGVHLNPAKLIPIRIKQEPAPVVLPEEQETVLFNRSPHVRTSVPACELQLPQKEHIGDKPEYNWMTTLLPQAVMLIVMVAVFFFTGVGSLFFTVPMYCVTILTGILSFSSQKRKYKKKKQAIEGKFQSELAAMQQKIDGNKCRQMEILKMEFPSPESCSDIVRNRDARLWRVRPDEPEFLNLRLGIGTVGTSIKIQSGLRSKGCEELVANAGQLEDAPISCPVNEYNVVGLVGRNDATLSLLQNMVIQTAVNHSYEEVKMVVFTSESEAAQWKWTHQLPHMQSEDRRLYFAATPADIQQLAREMEEVLSCKTGRGAEIKLQQTYYLFIVRDSSLLNGQLLMNYLTTGKKELQCCVLFSANTRGALPSGCKAIIETDGGQGRWYPTSDNNATQSFRQDQFTGVVRRQLANALSKIQLDDSVVGPKMPKSVTFLEGYGVKSVEELDIATRWKDSRAGKSFSVPIGIRENGEPFYFDISQKKHGPNGMVAGSCGSGKSDLVQSWILSMALHFKPTEISFIIVDYKGDGLLAPFRRLPHLVGTISNLDHNVERNVVALNSELMRRQQLFKECGAHNIEDYFEQYRHEKVKMPLPYLIVVIDEFADFKVNHPEFMPIVNAIYTKGRSLGVYAIILAQDAAAAANGSMIPVNSHFHWCMKVDTDDASTGMLGTREAYTMPKIAGRGFIKVGNFEVYEMIQAFWSGAPAPQRGEEKTWSVRKEIDCVVDYICDYTRRNHIPIPSQIWRPALPAELTLDTLLPERFERGRWPGAAPVGVTLGMVDDPAGQRQFVLEYSFHSSGHISVQGGPESGKSTLLMTAALSLTLRYSPEDVALYLFDFDKWALNLVRNLPHVRGSSAAAEPEEIKAIIEDIRNELNRRRILFLKAGAISLEGYCAMAEKLPAIVLVIDNIFAAWEEDAAMQDLLSEVAQKGAGYGIYMLASSPGTSFPYKLTTSFKTRLTLRQNERSDYSGIVGRSELTPENYPGRGLAKFQTPVEIQAALPVSGGTEQERSLKIHEIVEELRAYWTPAPADPAPEVVDWRDLELPGEIVLGIDRRFMEPVTLSASGKHCLLISGMTRAFVDEMLSVLLRQMAATDGILIIFDDRAHSMREQEPAAEACFACGDVAADDYLAGLMEELNRRAEQLEQEPKAAFQPIYLVFADWREFFEGAADQSISFLIDVVSLGGGLGVYLLAAGIQSGIAYLANLGETLTNRLIMQRNVILLGGSIAAHGLFQTGLPTAEENAKIAAGCGCYLLDSKVCRISLLKEMEAAK